MSTTHVVDESLLKTLKELRSEEQALLGLLKRANIESSAQMLRDHRRRLGRIRQKIDACLPEAFQMCSHCVEQAQRLRRTIQGLRLQLQTLHEKAQKTEHDTPYASHARIALRLEYNRVYTLLERHEYYLNVLDDFLPGVPEKLHSRQPDQPPIVERPIGIETVSPCDLASDATAPPALEAASRDGAPPPADPACATKHPSPVDSNGPSRVQAVPDQPPSVHAPARSAPQPVGAPGAGPAGASRKTFQSDRRAHKRVPLCVPMRFRLDGQSYIARSADVSMGGMFIETARSVPAGTEVTVLFCAAEGFPIELAARVMYEMKGVGLGVKFLSMPESDGRYLEALIQAIDEEP